MRLRGENGDGPDSRTETRVIKYFKETTPLSIGQKPFNESKRNESLICILGWLHSVEATETGFNLIAGFMRWRANERRTFSHSPIDGEKGGVPITVQYWVACRRRS